MPSSMYQHCERRLEHSLSSAIEHQSVKNYINNNNNKTLLQRVLDSILTLPNFRLLSSCGLAWTFPMVHAAHCALRLPWIHLAIMLLPAKGVVMWFPATINCVISLRSPAGELIWVSRWKWVTISPITATPVQLTF